MKAALLSIPAFIWAAAANSGDIGFSGMPEMCASCHGQDGASSGSMPSLAHLDEESVQLLLEAYRSGEIEGTIMNRIARGLTDAEIASLAEYFGELEE